MSIEVVVQSSSISSIESNNPTRNRNRNTSSNDGLYQSHTITHHLNNICNTTTTLVQEEEEEEEVVGGGERKRRRRREQLQQQQEEEEEEERENQLKFVGLLFTAFRRSVFGCSSTSSSSSCDIIKTGLISSSCSGSNTNNNTNTNTNKGGGCGGGMEIGLPTNVRHVAHVTFDRFNGFLGLPVEFQPEVPTRPPSASTTVFGVSTNSMQLSFDTRGNSVPTILLLMQHRLYAIGGLQAEGIFRINPDNGREEHVRDQLNRGLIPDDVDVHCLAGLIKAWFRELPTGVLDCLSPEQVMESQTEEECFQLAKLLPPTEAALLDWAVNLMADVAQLEHLNKMNARNVAMVFAPNMTHMADPLTALMHAVQVMNFLKTLIERTLKEREDAILDSALDSYSRDPSGDNGCHTPLQTIHEENNESDVDVGGVRSSKAMNPGAADDDDDVSSTDENINSSIIPGENHQSTVSNNYGEEEGKIVTSEDKKTKLCNKTKNYCRVGQSCTSKKGVRKSNEKPVIEVNKVGEKTKGSILGVTLRSERIEAWR